MTRCLVVLLALAFAACGSKKDKDVPPAATASGSAPAPATASKAEAFWAWFREHAAALRADADMQKTMESISSEVEKAYPGVFAEIGKEGDDRMLVLSVDGKKDLFPAVQELYAARPKDVKGWTIVAFRPRAKPGEMPTIEIEGKKLEPEKIKFVGAPADGKLDITVFIPGFTTMEEMGNLGFVILDHTVGEYDLETKVGGIDFAALDKAPRDAKPLSELPKMVDALK